MLLHGKVMMIAGIDDAVGKITALAAINAGARVVLVSTKENGDEEFVNAIDAWEGQVFYQAVNITISEELERLFDLIANEFGRLDIAFNNATKESEKRLLSDLKEEDVAETIDTNVYGTWLLMKYEIEQMLKNKSGVIVNNSGILGVNALPTTSLESATKAAIVSLTKAAALEYARSGIRINAVAPGFIKSIDETSNGSNREFSFLPMGRFGKPEEVAEAVVWLCSELASFTTGHVFPIDGGFSSC